MAEGGTMEEDRRGRLFGLNDTFCHHLVTKYGMGYYMHVGIFQSNERLSADIVKDSFITLVKRQEMLQMKVETIPDEVFMHKYTPVVDLNQIDFRVKSINSLDEWKPFCESSVDMLDKENGQLWRVYYLPVEEQNYECDLSYEFVIVFVAHHCMVDAISVFDLLYRQFMPILSAIVNQEEATEIVPVMPLLEPNEVIFQGKKKDPNHLPWYLKYGLKLLLWKNRTFGSLFIPDLKYSCDTLSSLEDMAKKIPHGKLGASVYPVVFSEELTSAIIRSAKSHGVTVQCMLLAVNSMAICATAEDAGVKLPETLRQGWPTDLRKYANIVSPHPLSCLNGGGFTNTKKKSSLTDTEFWKTCRIIHKDLQKQTRKENATGFLSIYKYFNDTFIKDPQTMDVFAFVAFSSISNIGNCDSGPSPVLSAGPVKVDMKENYFMLPVGTPKQHIRAMMCFHTVSTFKGKMIWNAGYNPMLMGRKFLDNMMSKIQGLLRHYTEGSPV